MQLLVPNDAKGEPYIYRLQRERHALRKVGVGYLEWRAMTRWQRADALMRYAEDTKVALQAVKEGGIGGIVSVVLGKFLGA